MRWPAPELRDTSCSLKTRQPWLRSCCAGLRRPCPAGSPVQLGMLIRGGIELHPPVCSGQRLEQALLEVGHPLRADGVPNSQIPPVQSAHPWLPKLLLQIVHPEKQRGCTDLVEAVTALAEGATQARQRYRPASRQQLRPGLEHASWCPIVGCDGTPTCVRARLDCIRRPSGYPRDKNV